MRNLARVGFAMFCLALLMIGTAHAQSISLNFSENAGNQHFTGGEMIGPSGTDSAKWNNTNDYGGSLDAGTMTNLIDDSGDNTGASVTWECSNVWWNSDGTGDDEHRMAVGYLDDGETGDPPSGLGVQITFENIPYDYYRVYGLLASDMGGGYDPATGGGGLYETLNFNVNGQWVFGGDATTTAPAYNSIEASLALAGDFWTEANGVDRGNYWAIDARGPTLTIEGLPRSGDIRGSITSVIIQQIPEPSTLILTVMGLLGLVMYGRRK